MSNFKVLAFLTIVLTVIQVDFGNCGQQKIVTHEQDMELEIRLQSLNKPFVKTMITPEGDVIDCVRYYDQPAFDHPALKNHKIQMQPTSFPFEDQLASLKEMQNGRVSISIRGTREACPDGSVPIKRTTKQDILEADSFPWPGSSISPNDQLASNYRQVDAGIKFRKQRASGTSGNLALYNLSIADDQTSMAAIWVSSTPDASGHAADFINVGWVVSRQINGDGLTRLFGYWHNNRDNNGCINNVCPGFVQVDKEIPINYAFQKTSIAGDENQQFSTFLFLYQDPQTGNWWLTASKDNVNIGYWPKELFIDLPNGAYYTNWGGQTFPGANGQFPPMGNGRLPNGRYIDTCYFDAIHYYVGGKKYDILQKEINVNIRGSDCYQLELTEDSEPLITRPFSFTFGGPGGTCTAP